MPAQPVFKQITIIGLGLIGSSIARAVHKHKLATTLIGSDLNEVSLAYARKGNFIDKGITDPKSAVADSDLIIIATPPSTLEAVAETIAPNLKPGSIVMDVCSVKQPAIAAIAPHIPANVHFIPAHPIAGSEHSGVSNGRADLFDRKRVIVTPKEPKQDATLQNITTFWKELGARCEAMPAHLHDLIYAYVSHLPQLLAFAAIAPLEPYADRAESDPVLQKFMRLCNSNPEMWTDIFLLNKDNVVQALDRYLDVITHISHEFKEAPKEERPTAANKKMARTTLFPRIAASCLVTTVMEAEKKAGFSFARYTGTGFADFTYPASQVPEEDIETISQQHRAVAKVLEEYIAELKKLRSAINAGDDNLFAA